MYELPGPLATEFAFSHFREAKKPVMLPLDFGAATVDASSTDQVEVAGAASAAPDERRLYERLAGVTPIRRLAEMAPPCAPPVAPREEQFVGGCGGTLFGCSSALWGFATRGASGRVESCADAPSCTSGAACATCGEASAAVDLRSGVVTAMCGGHACVAVKQDTSAVAWGDDRYGGDASGVDLRSGVVERCAAATRASR